MCCDPAHFCDPYKYLAAGPDGPCPPYGHGPLGWVINTVRNAQSDWQKRKHLPDAVDVASWIGRKLLSAVSTTVQAASSSGSTQNLASGCDQNHPVYLHKIAWPGGYGCYSPADAAILTATGQWVAGL